MQGLKGQDDDEEEQVSVLQGDALCMSRILARESSAGRSSGVFYRSSEGVPFRWEMHPGTPKDHLREDEDAIPPICPSPLMQSLALPLPNLDPVYPPLKTSKISRFFHIFTRKKREISSFSSICSHRHSSRRVVDVCPWNIDDEETRLYYGSQQKNNTLIAAEEDDNDLLLSRILSGVSASKTKNSALEKAWSWIRRYGQKKESKKMSREISFRYHGRMEGEVFDDSLRKSASVSPLSKGGWRVSKIRRNSLRWSRSGVLLFAKRKWKSFTS